MRGIVIAIDGTASSGKTTTARLLGKKLGFHVVETGAMYRAITLKVLREKVDIEDREKIKKILDRTEIDQRNENCKIVTFLDGEDVTEEIRKPEVDKHVSVISLYPEVREKMVSFQRKIAERGKVIMEGRDIGTVVFPQADVKIFMDASLEVRARRRFKELKERGIGKTLEEVLREMKERDRLDKTREISPLRKAKDAIFVDTTNLSVEEQVDLILKEIERRLRKRVES